MIYLIQIRMMMIQLIRMTSLKYQLIINTKFQILLNVIIYQDYIEVMKSQKQKKNYIPIRHYIIQHMINRI